ncbi:hypothetical protein K466DRAFT_574615 [Polyporus arcularius HHB13444]|uniref:YDG domain-containing protein n=1 Tax=Polyporus arcularius HHB13444 TaxID=1314778 RepID=A0A5C3PUH4_9APHY|nr:hypothetical protein K466DRAFT_574615 [Polyporus arcularius HHB13444]
MSPSPLSPNVVHLTHAIPPHLLSKPLLQRHHFLHLTPEQPDEYLCWPSSPEKKAHVIELLESRPRPIDDDQPTVFPVQYSFDGEDFFAHVDLSSGHNSGPRVLLQWDDDVGDWRYHNTDLMPFPPGCRAELEDVLVPPAAPNPVSLHSIATPSYHSFDVDSLQDDSDDDDYWNAYGASDIGDSHYGEGAPASAKDTAASSEDAYWAQYASVQGTADSTIPSPMPQGRRKPLPPVHTESEKAQESPVPLPVPVRVPSEDTYAEPLPIPPSIMPRPRSNSRWDPASPTHLAHLLSTISPRESPAESPAPDGSFDVDEDSSSPTIGGSDDSDLSSSPALGLQGTGIVAGPEREGSNKGPSSLRGSLRGDWLIQRMPSGSVLGAPKAMDDDSATTPSDFAVWKRLLEDQTALFEKTFTQNAQLEARVEELERELSVWKEAFKTADGDRKVLNKTVLKLERSIGALKEDNPLIVCLIDGDGNIFSSDLIKLGQYGGRQAAMLLTKGLTDYLSSVDPTEASAPGRGQLWLTIYCNKSGLVDTLTSNSICTAEEFEAFVLGFNQASPLFSIVDVGNGKEAADSKIKEYLRVFTRFPQTSKVFFGGAHDNGYTSTLNLLQNEGLLDKVVLLKGYKDLAHEIYSLRLPQLDIEGVFIQKKLQTNSKYKPTAAVANSAGSAAGKSPKPPKQPMPLSQDNDKARHSKPGTPIPNATKAATPARKPRKLDPDQKPPPCNFFYLARCNNGDHCKYEHNYPLTPDQVAELRTNAKRWPCPAVNNGNYCPLGESCIMNHFCPKGPKCSFRKQGKCKFIGRQKTKKAKVDQSKKRGAPREEPPNGGTEETIERPAKLSKVEDGDGTVRRSARNRGKTTNYNDEGDSLAAGARALPRILSAKARAGMQGAPREIMIRKYDPKTYGAIPGVPVGSWWETREACSKDSIHAPWVAGISAGPQGAYSVALSGGYEDDVDLGEAFTYTGSGGRDLKGTKANPKNLRTAPQTSDQTFENNYNKALLRSSETKKPVRVIRGPKLRSPYAPAEGYRYDGLYTVEKAWMEKGLNPKGYLVCKFALKRVPGQAPLLLGNDDDNEDDVAEQDNAGRTTENLASAA